MKKPMLARSGTTLRCFSPEVMLATFLFEVGGALWSLWRYKLNSLTRVIVMTLVCLAIFQLAEYNVCEGAFGFDSLTWSKLGFVAITMLPPLGIHLVTIITHDHRKWHLYLMYGVAVAFASVFLFHSQGMQSQQCLGNYVIFTIAPWAAQAFGAYYYSLLLVGVGYAYYQHQRIPKETTRKALAILEVGYLAFIVPTVAVYYITATTLAGVPSIMCGFAVLLAAVLVLGLMPTIGTRRKRKQK